MGTRIGKSHFHLGIRCTVPVLYPFTQSLAWQVHIVMMVFSFFCELGIDHSICHHDVPSLHPKKTHRNTIQADAR